MQLLPAAFTDFRSPRWHEQPQKIEHCRRINSTSLRSRLVFINETSREPRTIRRAPSPLEPPAKLEQTTRSIKAKHERYWRAHDLLVERYPAIFAAARPLAVGVDKQPRDAVSEEELSTANLKAFLRTWVNRKPYRAALARGDRRVNLDGSDAGPALGPIEAVAPLLPGGSEL